MKATVKLPAHLYTELLMRMQQNFFAVPADYTVTVNNTECQVTVYSARCYEFITFYYGSRIIR